jgi:hypothetical protein
MLFARRSPDRFVASEWLIAIAAATIAFLIQRQTPLLTDPVACPGLLESIAIAAGRSASRVPMATVLTWMNVALVPLSVLVLSLLIQRAGGSLASAAAVSVAAAVTVVTAPTLAPPSVAAIGAASLAFLAYVPTAGTGGVLRRLLAPLWLAITAAMAPALAVPLAIVAAWIGYQSAGSSRALGAVLAGTIVIGLPVLLQLTIPSLPGEVIGQPTLGCLLPRGFSIDSAKTAVSEVFRATGPLPMALALLGAFVSRALAAQRDAWPVMAIALLPVVATGWSDSQPLRTLAPAIAAFWCLVAAGLREIVAALALRPAWRAGAWSLAALLPVLQWTHRSAAPIDPAGLPHGHQEFTRRSFSQLIGALPTGSTIVIDDAISDLLWRGSTKSAQQSGKSFRFVSRNGQDAIRAATDTVIFTMPRAQDRLQHQGLARVDAADPGIPGVVAFTVGGACTTIESQWRESEDLSKASAVAVVADRGSARGPVHIYLGGNSAFTLEPLEWPAWSMRGYHADAYDRSRESDRQRLDRHRTEDGAPADHQVFAYQYIARLELWRVPNGPLILPVGLGQKPAAAMARAITAGDANGLRLCPSFISSASPPRSSFRSPD